MRLDCEHRPAWSLWACTEAGTSLLTGSLEAAGLNLGEVNNAAPHNRKGNKENEADSRPERCVADQGGRCVELAA